MVPAGAPLGGAAQPGDRKPGGAMRRLFFGHPRLWIAVIAATAAFFVLPGQWSILSRVLVCWNGGVDLFLVLIFRWMTRLTAAQICSRYIEEDASAPIILLIVTLAAMLS